MTLQSSGQISYDDIQAELGDTATQMSMDSFTAQAIGDATITNPPDGIEDWYGYTHTQVPSAPSGVTASEQGDGVTIDINWTDNSAGAEQENQFRIEYSYNGGGYTFLTNTAQDATYHGHAALNCPGDSGDTYRYRIRAENDAGNSGWAYSSVLTIGCA